VLRHLPSVVHPNVLVDAASRDDAAVYRLTPDRASVATVDFFTPIVDDPAPKFGMCVIGEVHPDRLLTNAGARPGDRLVLTKPLGTGILSTALKRELIDDSAMAPAVRSMRALNRGAARAALAHGVTTATDVTGFGLWGHLENILNASGVGAELSFDALPLLPRARELADQGVVPGGTERNYAAAEKVDWDPQLTQGERYLTVDAQTSGGLLLAVAPGRLGALLLDLESNGTLAAATIGTLNTHQGQLRVTR
jgi:selenide,water dikinase